MRHSQRVALAAALAMLVAIAVAAPVAAADPDVIVVAPGENLTVIAARHGTSVAELVTLNLAGQRLSIPGAAAAQGTTAPSPAKPSPAAPTRAAAPPAPPAPPASAV